LADRPDYYALLGVTRSDSELAIRAAYRRLVLAHHPDRHPDDAGAVTRLSNLVEAYETLGDPAARARYDQGHSLPRKEESNGLEEVLGRVVDAFVGVHDARHVDGRDRQYRLSISFESAARGTTETLELPEPQPCATCDGRGFPLEVLPQVCHTCQGAGAQEVRRTLRRVIESCVACSGLGYSVSRPCESCAGVGTSEVRRKVEIQVPAGVMNGARLVVRGAGEDGEGKGASGDCFVLVEVLAHPYFERRGQDVVMTRPVTVLQAIRGGWIKVPTLDGPRRVHLPSNAEPKLVLRMLGLGVGDKAGQRGDQLVHIEVEQPAKLSSDLEETLGRLDEISGPDVFPTTRKFEASFEAEVE